MSYDAPAPIPFPTIDRRKYQDAPFVAAWHPIATADKQEPVLVCEPGNGFTIVHWNESHQGWFDDHGSQMHPTHWMPLPDWPTDLRAAAIAATREATEDDVKLYNNISSSRQIETVIAPDLIADRVRELRGWSLPDNASDDRRRQHWLMQEAATIIEAFTRIAATREDEGT